MATDPNDYSPYDDGYVEYQEDNVNHYVGEPDDDGNFINVVDEE